MLFDALWISPMSTKWMKIFGLGNNFFLTSGLFVMKDYSTGQVMHGTFKISLEEC